MKNTLCGIEISQEHANLIIETCNRIIEEADKRTHTEALKKFRVDFVSMQGSNPHNRFYGTPEEYLRKYPGIKL
jgi:hypothetical protein